MKPCDSIGTAYVCAYPGCHKEYSTKFALKRHALTHSKVKKFECRYCTRKFALDQYRKEHEYIHTNETPYVCGIDGCTESFRQRAKLCLHRKTHGSYSKKQYKVYSKKKSVRSNNYVQDITMNPFENYDTQSKNFIPLTQPYNECAEARLPSFSTGLVNFSSMELEKYCL